MIENNAEAPIDNWIWIYGWHRRHTSVPRRDKRFCLFVESLLSLRDPNAVASGPPCPGANETLRG
jgi:hypothetical protein